MSDATHSDAKIFAAALEYPALERAAYLDVVCGNDAALRARIEALLHAHDEAGRLLDAAPGSIMRAALAQSSAEEKPGAMIGRYKLLQKIGEGGCGTVWMAEQQEPIRRRVALKVIKLGMDTKEVIARFEAERQALAVLGHPNIARVLDAGATEAGRPFFVMELVRGVKITDYCDQHNLPTAARLKIFSQVCHAIDHAHAKGIVHRDIKPSNILVTVIDGAAVPKVIDFGIAKATQGGLTDRTLFTAFEQFIGTPAYMSPEQAEMSGVEIDPRSDIYSLGALLYELLTGRPPFDPQELRRAGLEAMRRCIREVEPPRPSTRLNTLEADALNTTALHRNIAASRLIHSLRGDLDWIAMRCLEKDRHRRYQSAAALADDLRRHLEHRPVTAHRPDPFYRLGKFIRRHRNNLAIAGGALLLGLGAGLWLYWQSNADIARTPVSAPRAATAADAAGKVGSLGELEVIAFSGNRAFSNRAIREGLAGDNTFFLAAHPEAPREELITVVQRAVLRGYRGLGFPEATVAVRINAGKPRLEVAIEEGPRFVRGDVVVHGASHVSAVELARALAAPEPGVDKLAGVVTAFLAQQTIGEQMMEAQRAIQTLASTDPSDASSRTTIAPPDLFTPPAHPANGRWVEGTPASFADDEIAYIVAIVRQFLDQQGYPLAEVQARLELDRATGRARLQLDVHEGPTVTIGTIQVYGQERNSTEEIIRCTGLVPGLKLDAAVIARAKVALWSSARFYAFDLAVHRPPPGGNTCDVTIVVDESKLMPPLREELPRHQAALVRFANWMTTESGRREFNFSASSGDLPDIAFAVTPEKHAAVYVEGATTDSLVALLVRPEGVRLFGAGRDGNTGLDLSRTTMHPHAFIHLTTYTLAGDPHHANATFGVGWTRETGDASSDFAPIIINPTMACQYLVPKAIPSFENGEVVLNDTVKDVVVRIRFREATGELIEFNAVPLGGEEENPLPRLSLRLGGDDFARIARRVDEQWSQLPYDPARRRSLADLLLTSDLRRQSAVTPAARSTIVRTASVIRLGERLLATPEMRVWLDYAPSPEDPAFPIPIDPKNPEPANDIINTATKYLYQFGRKFIPAQSWPTRLIRELPYLFQGQLQHSRVVFDDLATDKDMGPIGSLLLARLLGRSPQGWHFARRTLDHGSLAEFRQDYHTLFESDTTVARFVRGVLPGIAAMSDEELEQFIGSWPANDAVMARLSLAALRNSKAEGIAAALRPILETWWERQMEPHLADRISRFLSDGKSIDPALVAATVNGRAISRKLLKAVQHNPSLLTAAPPMASPVVGGQSYAEPALKALITLVLVHDDADNRGVAPSDEIIGHQVEKIIREKYRGDRHVFEAMLTSNGITVDDFRYLTRINLSYERLCQAIEGPAATSSSKSSGVPSGLPQGRREFEASLNAEQRQAIANQVKRLHDSAFVYVIPEPTVVSTR